MERFQLKRGLIYFLLCFVFLCTIWYMTLYLWDLIIKCRVENLNKFRNEEGDCPTLVCTDLAARGLDLDVDHVIMFDFPSNSVCVCVCIYSHHSDFYAVFVVILVFLDWLPSQNRENCTHGSQRYKQFLAVTEHMCLLFIVTLLILLHSVHIISYILSWSHCKPETSLHHWNLGYHLSISVSSLQRDLAVLSGTGIQ
jgi:hypothetical protein